MSLTIVACGGGDDEQKTTSNEKKADEKVAELTSKYEELLVIVNETSYAAFVNGWENDEEYNLAQEAALTFLEIVNEDLQFPDRMDIEFMDRVIVKIDEMIPVWLEYRKMVSESYKGN